MLEGETPKTEPKQTISVTTPHAKIGELTLEGAYAAVAWVVWLQRKLLSSRNPATDAGFQRAAQLDLPKRVLEAAQSTLVLIPAWMLDPKHENAVGRQFFQATRRLNDEHQIEKAGKKLRATMPWIGNGKPVDNARDGSILYAKKRSSKWGRKAFSSGPNQCDGRTHPA